MHLKLNIKSSMSPVVPNCVSPLLFELIEDSAAYAPYSIGGSGFLAKYLNRYYFITAGHCLKGGLHNDLRIPVAPGKSETLPFECFGRVKFDDAEDDTDHGDFALLSLPENFEPRKLPDALEAAHVPETLTWQLLREEFMLTLRGYPYAAPETGIDMARGKISTQALVCDAYFSGEAESKYCYKLDFIESCPVSNMNGMSGSPVFAKLPNQKAACYVLVGVHIRANRFISIEVIKDGIRKFT